MNQTEKVRDFFDVVSEEYRGKYEKRQIFHNYFFNQRLEQATEGLDLKGKTILDIGAGTGNLYDFILAKDDSIDFYACDISGKMLEQSRIPAARRFVGKCYEIDFPVEKFDYIFMLGVTTYLSADEMEKTAEFVYRKLADDGTAIITFTNRKGFDTITRTLGKNVIRLFKLKNKVISQSFRIYAYSLNQVESLYGDKLRMKEVRFINQTIFPFCYVFPKLSVNLAERLASRIKNKPASAAAARLSSDFIVFYRKI
ncbi:MAG TPA: class I SAM-dependent methyltransferase [Pyrinomonadaceae bacterium]|nr:class I SAM-dependent methyltransferase [Pyrinomonadaceae bacterium]